MTRTSPPQRAMSSGEISPLLARRHDYQRHQTGLARCRGFLPMVQGGVTRAPGTVWRGHTRDDLRAVLVPFQFAVNDAVVLEFTAFRMRVWRYGHLVERAGAIYELATPYSGAALAFLHWVQSADVVWLADGFRPIYKLSRRALDDWSLQPAEFLRGPFRAQNLDEGRALRMRIVPPGGAAISSTAQLRGVLPGQPAPPPPPENGGGP